MYFEQRDGFPNVVHIWCAVAVWCKSTTHTRIWPCQIKYSLHKFRETILHSAHPVVTEKVEWRQTVLGRDHSERVSSYRRLLFSLSWLWVSRLWHAALVHTFNHNSRAWHLVLSHWRLEFSHPSQLQLPARFVACHPSIQCCRVSHCYVSSRPTFTT